MVLARKRINKGYYSEQGLQGNYKQESYLTPPVAQKKKSTAFRARKSSAVRESMLLYFLLVVLVAVGIGVISQYGRIVACNYRIQHLQKEIALLQEERESLSIEVKRLGSLERIEKIAAGELGLQHPEKRQWLVLSARGK